MIYLMQATEIQLNKIKTFLDLVLRQKGLAGLEDVVDIYNVVHGAEPLKEAPNQEQMQQVFEQAQSSTNDVGGKNG